MTRWHRLQAEGLREGKQQPSVLGEPWPTFHTVVPRMGAVTSPFSSALTLLSLVPLFERGLQLLSFSRWEEFTPMTAVLATCPMWN